MKMLDAMVILLSVTVLFGLTLLCIDAWGTGTLHRECEAAGYTDTEYEDGTTYCIRAEGNDLVGRSLEAIRVEARGQ